MKHVTSKHKALIKRQMEILLAEVKREEPMHEPCTRITDGKPRAAFDTEEEAEAFALRNEDYVGDLPWRCVKCGKVHLYRPDWLLPNRVAQIRRGDEVLSSPIGDQDACIDWLRQNLKNGDEVLHIASRDLVLQ